MINKILAKISMFLGLVYIQNLIFKVLKGATFRLSHYLSNPNSSLYLLFLSEMDLMNSWVQVRPWAL